MRITAYNKGRLDAVGDPFEVMTPENIFDAYGMDVEMLEFKGRRILLTA